MPPTKITTRRQAAHLITSAMVELRARKIPDEQLATIADVMVAQMFGQAPTSTRAQVAQCALRAIDGMGAWEALGQFGIGDEPSDAALRRILRDEYGSGRFRIRSDGGIDAYGQMPNTNYVGWYFVGWVDDWKAHHATEMREQA